jgi:hypothetical protein
MLAGLPRWQQAAWVVACVAVLAFAALLGLAFFDGRYR